MNRLGLLIIESKNRVLTLTFLLSKRPHWISNGKAKERMHEAVYIQV